MEGAFEDVGFRVRRNEPFPGGWTVSRFQQDDRVDAIQIELNQRTYLRAEDVDAAAPNPRRDEASWRESQRRLTTALGALRGVGERSS